MLDLTLPSLTHVTRGLHHALVWQSVEGALRKELPVLYIFRGPDRTPEPLLTLFEYTKAHASRSATWHLYRLRTIGALVDFVIQCGSQYQQRTHAGGRSPARNLFSAFVQAMVRGTIKIEDGTLQDPTGLFWLSSGVKEVERRVEALHDVARWLDTEGYGSALANASLPEIPSDSSGVLAFLYTTQVVRRVSLLSYLSPFKKVAPKRTRGLFGRQGSSGSKTTSFPDSKVKSLLTFGFPNDFSALLNVMFMLGGGLRESEGLHVWVSDVQYVDDEAVLFLYHPSEGVVIVQDGKTTTRRQYLLDKFSRVPRCDLLRGPEAVGWKGVRGDIDGAQVHWLPGQDIGRAVGSAVRLYLRTVREPIMRLRRHMGLPDHPYLLISTDAKEAGRHIGDPYTMSAFNSAWKRGVARAFVADNEALPDIVKRSGLTPHSCRHRYAQTLVDLKLDGAMIQQCMRHVNPFSHLAYKNLPASKVNALLEAAGERHPAADWGLGKFLSTSDALLSEQDRRHGLV